MPTLSGGKYHYRQLHKDPSSSYYQDFPTNPKLDDFCHVLVDGWLANHKTLPSTYLKIKTYLNRATTTLMGTNNIKSIWTLKPSPRKVDLWVEAIYNLGESLTLFMGFLEYDCTGQTRIVTHNDLWMDTGKQRSHTL